MQWLTDFAHERGGNFAMMMAVLSVPLVMSAGVVLDVSSISRIKAELQQAIDSATLAVAREGNDLSDAEARQIAETFLSQNLDPRHTDLQIVRSDTGVSVKAATRANLAFGGLFGYDDWPILAAASTETAYVNYEIALVLDTTGSMAGGKLVAMKDAVVGLIDTMSSQVADREKLNFSLVPFSSFVNVGADHGPRFDDDGVQIAGTGASWLDLEGRAPVAQTEIASGVSRFQLYHNLGQEWTGCVETRMRGDGDYDVTTAQARSDRPETLYVPAFAVDEPDHGGYANSYLESDVDPFDTAAAAKKARWAKYGVPTDGDGDPLLINLLDATLDLLGLGGDGDGDEDNEGDIYGVVSIDDGPSGHQGYDKGPGFGCGAQPLTPLSNDYSDLRRKVGELEAQGTTNITEGVAWGARVLTPGAPFDEAREPDAGIEKIMVVLSDGSNVLGHSDTDFGSQYSSYGYLVDGRLGLSAGSAGQSNGLMNERTLAACQHAKDADIVVYTIRLEEPDVETGRMLEECATSPAHFFDAPSRNQLDDIFSTIRDRIVRLRLAS